MRNLAFPILAITSSHDPNPISSLHRHLFLINSVRIQLLCSDESIHPSLLSPHQSCAPHLTFSWFHSCILHKRSTGTDTSRLSKATTWRNLNNGSVSHWQPSVWSISFYLLFRFFFPDKKHCGSLLSASYPQWPPQHMWEFIRSKVVSNEGRDESKKKKVTEWNTCRT